MPADRLEVGDRAHPVGPMLTIKTPGRLSAAVRALLPYRVA